MIISYDMYRYHYMYVYLELNMVMLGKISTNKAGLVLTIFNTSLVCKVCLESEELFFGDSIITQKCTQFLIAICFMIVFQFQQLSTIVTQMHVVYRNHCMFDMPSRKSAQNSQL